MLRPFLQQLGRRPHIHNHAPPSLAFSRRGFATTGSNNNHPNEPERRSLFSLARPLESLLIRTRFLSDPDAAKLVAKTIALSVYTLAGISLLGTLGLDTSPLLTGIGITGFTLGFAVKEVATNLLSGAMLVMGRSVRKGQWIRVVVASMPGVEGRVESVDVRNVVLRSREGNRIIVPSVIVFTNPLTIQDSEPTSHSKDQ